MSKHPGYENLLREGGYLWERPDNAPPVVPHVILPVSGLHSTGYFWSPVDNPDLMQTIAWELYDTLSGNGVSYDKLGIIVGPERETAPLVTLLTLCIQERGRVSKHQIRMCLTQKCGEGTSDEHQQMTEQCSTSFPNGARILVVENAVATGNTAIQTISAIEEHAKRSGITVEVLPIIGCIVNRLGRQSIRIGEREFRLIPYLDKRFSDWEPADCPLCPQGSPAVDPRRDWKALTA